MLSDWFVISTEGRKAYATSTTYRALVTALLEAERLERASCACGHNNSVHTKSGCAMRDGCKKSKPEAPDELLAKTFIQLDDRGQKAREAVVRINDQLRWLVITLFGPGKCVTLPDGECVGIGCMHDKSWPTTTQVPDVCRCVTRWDGTDRRVDSSQCPLGENHK